MIYTFFLVVFLWLVFLTGFLIRIFWYFRKLSKEVNKGNLIKILEKVLDKEGLNAKAIVKLEKVVAQIQDQNRFHIQRLAIIRFNPFKELGGDHSFSLVLLDDYANGVILTGLHARDRTRVYAKKITQGKCELSLSLEEAKALKRALKDR